MDDLDPELVEGAAMAAAYASGVSDWKHVSEHGDYDSREYWRRIANAVLAVGRPDLRAKHYAEALELAAEVADGFETDYDNQIIHNPDDDDEYYCGASNCANQIVHAIRALKDKA